MKVTEVKIKREEFSKHRYLQYNSMIEKYAKVTQQYLVAFTDFKNVVSLGHTVAKTRN